MDNRLKDALRQRAEVEIKRQEAYDNMIDNINQSIDEIETDKLGPQFVKACCDDIGGEIIRMLTPGTLANHGISVDQLYRRVSTFSYEFDYDPLVSNEAYHKTIYASVAPNMREGSTFDNLLKSNDANQVKLFNKSEVPDASRNSGYRREYDDNALMKAGKEKYAQSVRDNNGGVLIDEYTGEDPGVRVTKNGVEVNRAQVDHVQAAATARYNGKHIGEAGQQRLKEFYNSESNFSMMTDIANASKGDVKVYKKDGRILSQAEVKQIPADQRDDYDITHRATPEEYSNAVFERLENSVSKERLMEIGYLDKDGNVNPGIQKKFLENVKESQNMESVTILQALGDNNGAGYKSVGSEAALATKNDLKRIFTGQIIYYTLPPLVYEVRCGLENNESEESILEKITQSSKRVYTYVSSKLAEIFGNVLTEGMKSFIRNFFDILINMLKATVKRIMKMVKVFVVSLVDIYKIMVDPNKSSAEKGSAITSLLSVAITGVLIEIVFEYIEKCTGIPEIFLSPLQMLVTILASNFIMLGLKKLDLFGVNGALNKSAILKVMEEERLLYEAAYEQIASNAKTNIDQLINTVRNDCIEVTNQLKTMNMFEQEARPALAAITDAFNMNIDFDGDWK